MLTIAVLVGVSAAPSPSAAPTAVASATAAGVSSAGSAFFRALSALWTSAVLPSECDGAAACSATASSIFSIMCVCLFLRFNATRSVNAADGIIGGLILVVDTAHTERCRRAQFWTSSNTLWTKSTTDQTGSSTRPVEPGEPGSEANITCGGL